MLLFLFFSFFNALTLNELGTGYFQPLGSASPRFLLLSSYFLSLFAPRMRSLNFIIFVGLVFFFWLPILVKFGGIETLYVLITGKLLQPLELSRSDWRSGSGIYLSIRGPTAFFDELMSVIYFIEIDSGRGWITLDWIDSLLAFLHLRNSCLPPPWPLSDHWKNFLSSFESYIWKIVLHISLERLILLLVSSLILTLLWLVFLGGLIRRLSYCFIW